MNPQKSKFNTNKFYNNFLPMAQNLTDKLYLNLKNKEEEKFEKLMQLHEQCFHLNKCKRKQKCGESDYSAIIANILDAEVAKKSANLVVQKNGFGAMLFDAYCQNSILKDYLYNEDIFLYAHNFEQEINYIVDHLFVGKENFKEAIAIALNYAQFSCIYGIDKELSAKKQKEKRLTEFEKQLVNNPLSTAIETMNVMLELGQSGYIALFGGRTVCTGQAIMTASLLDLAFKKLGINGRVNLFTTDSHAFVIVYKDDKKYVIDPTQYFGSFKQIKKCDKENAKNINNAKILNHKIKDSKAHFKVIKYFLNELNMQEKLQFINQTEIIEMKLVKILAHMEKNLSKMSKLIYPKAVFVDNREISVENYFELCLNQANIPYITGCGTEDFVIKGLGKDYYIDLSNAFEPNNKLKHHSKFIKIEPNEKQKNTAKETIEENEKE